MGPVRFSRIYSPIFVVGFGVGVFTGVALALFVFTLLVDTRIEVAPDRLVVATTPEPDPEATATPEVLPRANAVLDVHIGPSKDYAIIGLLRKGDVLQIIGRNLDSTWLAVRFPPGSSASGWIPVEGIVDAGEVSSFAITFATPLPRSTARETPFVPFLGDGSGIPRPATPHPTLPAVTPEPLPDLVITALSRLADGRVSVSILNQGGAIRDQFIFVQVRTLTGRSETIRAPTTQLAAGASLTLSTSSFVVEQEEIVQAVANPVGNVREASTTNNLRQATLR